MNVATIQKMIFASISLLLCYSTSKGAAGVFPTEPEKLIEGTCSVGSGPLSPKDLSELTTFELRVARNTIYACNGKWLKSHDLRRWFRRFSWYRKTDYIGLSVEKRRNVELIGKIEEERRTKNCELFENLEHTKENSKEQIEIIKTFTRYSWDGPMRMNWKDADGFKTKVRRLKTGAYQVVTRSTLLYRTKEDMWHISDCGRRIDLLTMFYDDSEFGTGFSRTAYIGENLIVRPKYYKRTCKPEYFAFDESKGFVRKNYGTKEFSSDVKRMGCVRAFEKARRIDDKFHPYRIMKNIYEMK